MVSYLELVADLDQDFADNRNSPLSVIGPKLQRIPVDELNYLPTEDPSLFTVQKDYNEFLFEYLTNLTTDSDEPVYVSDTPPGIPSLVSCMTQNR